MKKLETGDKVRFLNTVGGGTVKGFLSKQLVIVEDEHGFDIPILISECVVVESAGNEKLGLIPENKETTTDKDLSPSVTEVKVKDNEPVQETAEGEKITACLAYLPTDVKNLSSSSYECYFVNDSNYYLFFNYMSRENNTWKSRYNGSIEPNTKIFLEEFDKTALNEIEKVSVQFIAFKYPKQFRFKNPCSVELRIDTVKFYKLHSFRENDYFEDEALLYYVMRDDVPERELLVSAGDLERAIKEKQAADRRPRIQRIEKKEKNQLIEIDLHADALLDTTSGLNNADLLEYQLNKFNEVMAGHIRNKNQKIVFIHGKGDGILRNAILKELKTKYPKCYYQDASFQEYGYGATMVTIK
ncbi:DUF2027 domain-containing protein [Proteiniphilum sp. UBA1028]|jgi:hypothetical protein|uniref:DUF2027 domain-containing protein n=1 Tax=Proteiniphilum sp. UBA1028 TaxID=1947251 RepID=UPI000E9026CD|nr:DUF2027 domain-containing protein [Proteiniphilum sp. UBA1028]HBG58991.1 DUF2027 domain-containing protein [Porphyromonadaceae bacterium]